MKIKEHMKAMHEQSAEHHLEMSKCHTAAMGKSEGGAADFHKRAAAAHANQAQYHIECAKDMAAAMKSEGDELGKRLVPDRVSGIAPEVPEGVRLVTRTGQREIHGERPNVPAQFEKLVSVEE